ncbi:MAG: DUF2577 family protein [Clostridiales bacterium]
MIEAMKELVQNTLNHWGLTDYTVGLVTSVSPLQVKIGDGLLLFKDNLILTQGLGALAENDKLTMLRVLRGQKYILLSKVVEK